MENRKPDGPTDAESIGEPAHQVPSPYSILVCEGEAPTVQRLRKALARLGWVPVGWARTGEQAVELAEQLRPDVILMDVHLPDVSGIEAVERIMQSVPTAIVMLTAGRDEGSIGRALSAGASGFLVKPLRDEQLLPTISVARARFAALEAERQQARAQAEAAARRIEADLQRVTELQDELSRERELARRLAESFFCTTPEVPGIRIETCYEPASRTELIGGDYYDLLQISPERLGVVIADVCGKGLPAAALTAVIRHTLRAYALEDPDPERVLPRLNRALCRHTTDECAFVTLFYGVVDLNTFELTYANAGHPEPVVCSAGGETVRRLEATDGMLGFIPEWEWPAHRDQIPSGGALVLYTDGVAEARRGRELMGTEGVMLALQELLREGAESLAEGLRERAHAFAGGEIRDDLTIVVLRRTEA